MEYSLNYLFLYLTWRCNLCCRHCWVSANSQSDEVIKKEIITQAIEESATLGVKTIKISGGEPFLYPELVSEVARLCGKYSLGLNIESNGTLINQEVLAEFKGIPVYINISLDSFDKDIHNSFRGDKNAFERTMHGIVLLQKQNIPFGITHTITEDNIAQLDELIYFLSIHNVSSLKLNPILKIGRATDVDDEFPYLLSVETYENIVKKYHCNEKNGVYVTTMVTPCFLSIPEMLTGKKRLYSCNFLNQLSILPDGRAGLCGEAKDIDPFIFGNINTQTIQEIWNESDSLNAFRYSMKKGMEGICGKCTFSDMCNGGCRIASYLHGRKYNSANPMADAYFSKHGSFPYRKGK